MLDRAVWDQGHPATANTRAALDFLAEGGLGLRLIDRIADKWGVIREVDDRNTTWFELSRP